MRSPDPFVLRYRPHINIVALCGGALGLMAYMDPRLRLYGLGVLFVAFLGWAHLTSRVKPRIGDYLEYLETAAEQDGHVDWLDQVESEFKFKWGIENPEQAMLPFIQTREATA